VPIKVRIVKGANLAMERIEAAVHGWPQAPYETKAEVDANYMRMVEYGCRPEPAEAVHLGIASHNLFDIAYGLVLREAHGVEPWVEFEMLEGMANHQARAVQARAGGLLLYAPVVRAEDFHSAIAYLVRRLDENTAPENFLRHVFDLASLVPPRADGLAGAAPLRIIGSGGGRSARAAIFTVIYWSP
jgi:RHH-type proline utilization regulon transcriptional repressor/proline dehydrogenase/delta 1-pyrroline-5-carboxylate dehydrogenase